MKVETVDGLNRLGKKKKERVWCRCWIIEDETGSRMMAQDKGRFFFLPLQDSAISYRPLSYPTSKTISSSHFSP